LPAASATCGTARTYALEFSARLDMLLEWDEATQGCLCDGEQTAVTCCHGCPDTLDFYLVANGNFQISMISA